MSISRSVCLKFNGLERCGRRPLFRMIRSMSEITTSHIRCLYMDGIFSCTSLMSLPAMMVLSIVIDPSRITKAHYVAICYRSVHGHLFKISTANCIRDIGCTMDHISRTFNSKLTYIPESPMRERIFSPQGNSSPMVVVCGSWKSKVFAKMKECKDAIKNAVTFDKTPIRSENVSSKGSTAPSMPDIVTYSVIARNSEEEDDLISSPISARETETTDASTGHLANTNNGQDGSFNYSLSADDSLESFLRNERCIAEEFPEEGAVRPVAKKKISAQPFLFYSEGSAEFTWPDDAEDSFSSGPLNRSQTSDVVFEIPQTNSTFCEFLDDSKDTGSTNIQDSGYENNVSM